MKCLVCNKENQNKICDVCIKNKTINEIVEKLRNIENIEYDEYREIINNVANAILFIK